LGCGGCMNESLAFTHSTPLIFHGQNDIFPSIEAECNRISDMLFANGYAVETIVLPAGSNATCIRNLGERQFSLPDEVVPDVILVLSCPSGFWGLSSRIQKAPLESIVKQIGMIYYTYSDNGKERHIIDCKLSSFADEKS